MRGGTHAYGRDICFTFSQFYCDYRSWNKNSKEHQSFAVVLMAFSPPHPSPNTAMMATSLLSLSESFSLYVAGRNLAHVRIE
jgi:hypothetical protein